MLPKIMHHCAFLIITFSSSYILCIQNGKTVSSSSSSSTVDKLKRRHFNPPEARQSSFQQNENTFDTSGFQPSNGPTGFRFPDKHQYNTNSSPNELLPSSQSLSFGYLQNPYPNNNREVANSINEEGANPYNLALNTGEHSANNNANNLNTYPYQQNANAIASFGSNYYQHHRDSPKVPNANDFYLSHQQSPSPLYQHQYLNNKNPYYSTPSSSSHQQHYDYQPIQRRPTYAEAFGNYLFNGQPNYNQGRPTPPPHPHTQPSAHGSESSYSPYQDGHLTGPYPYDDLTSPSGPSTSTYPSQYANQFGNFGSGGGFGTTSPTTATTGSANPLGSLLNSIGGTFASGNPISMQIIRGLENIARNDDLQCVPKVLCQMLGSPTRRAQLPSFITSPVLTRFVASLPSFSPALIYGRAALLGLSGGEFSCARTYNKCPQNEDDILYYLNNHRGGFFKFFSEPDSQDTQQQQQHHQYTTQPPSIPSYQQQQSPSSEPSIFNFLTGLVPTSSTTTNTNQGNVNSFMNDAITNTIGSLFGNIISGFLGGQGQGATRRNDDEDDIDVDDNPKKYSDLIESNSTTTSESDDEDELEVEGRILNNKSNILAYVEPPSVQHDNPISFPPENGNDNYETQQFQTEFRFPNTPPHRDTAADNDEQNGDYRRGKRVNFIDSPSSSDDFHRPSYDEGTKMIFPDRTGTGNLRFDNDEYFRVGKILNRPSDYNRRFMERENYRTTTTTTTTTRRPTNYYGSQNLESFNRYSSSNYYRKDYENQNQHQNREKEEDTSGNVYVTNGQGITEYYINASGKKVYI